MANLFLVTEPLRGWRHVQVSNRWTRLDWAYFVRDLVDVHYPRAERVILVIDQLDTPSPVLLQEAFPRPQGKRLAEKLEIHHTSMHVSWLNMEELELSVLQCQCLDRRVAVRPAVEREVAVWTADRNAATQKIDWRFTTEDAWIKLKCLYPAVHE